MIELSIPDMTCGHCVKTITTTVLRLDPKAQVQCELPTHRVQIESAVPRERLVQALADEGYPAR
jgi:copper chaperone